MASIRSSKRRLMSRSIQVLQKLPVMPEGSRNSTSFTRFAEPNNHSILPNIQDAQNNQYADKNDIASDS